MVFYRWNAATYITDFYSKVDELDYLDWKSIKATEWTSGNSDGDTDRMRKKQSEFLVRDHVPVEHIKGIVVLTEERRQFVQTLLDQYNLQIQVHVDTKHQFYYQ